MSMRNISDIVKRTVKSQGLSYKLRKLRLLPVVVQSLKLLLNHLFLDQFKHHNLHSQVPLLLQLLNLKTIKDLKQLNLSNNFSISPFNQWGINQWLDLINLLHLARVAHSDKITKMCLIIHLHHSNNKEVIAQWHLDQPKSHLKLQLKEHKVSLRLVNLHNQHGKTLSLGYPLENSENYFPLSIKPLINIIQSLSFFEEWLEIKTLRKSKHTSHRFSLFDMIIV